MGANSLVGTLNFLDNTQLNKYTAILVCELHRYRKAMKEVAIYLSGGFPDTEVLKGMPELERFQLHENCVYVQGSDGTEYRTVEEIREPMLNCRLKMKSLIDGFGTSHVLSDEGYLELEKKCNEYEDLITLLQQLPARLKAIEGILNVYEKYWDIAVECLQARLGQYLKGLEPDMEISNKMSTDMCVFFRSVRKGDIE
jgi:hypothetical protein